MAAVTQNAGANSPVRKKQKMMLMALAGVLAVVAFSVAFVGSNGPAPVAPPSPSSDIRRSFGDPAPKVNPQEQWRTNEAARVQSLSDQLTDLRKQLDQERRSATEDRSAKAAAEDRRAADERARASAASLPPAAPAATLPPLPPLQPVAVPNARAVPPSQGAAQAGGQQPFFPTGGNALPPQPGFALPMTSQGEPVKGIVRIDLADTKKTSSGGAATTSTTTVSAAGSVQAAAQRRAEKSAGNYIPPGSFVRAINLTGVDAPTGGQSQSDPHPMLFRVVDFAVLPNHFRADYKECFITGAAHGSLSTERAMVRLDKVSCISRDGAAVDADVKGYVSDETGKTGMKGRLVSKQGQVIANALLAGVASGIGSAFSNSATTTTTTAAGPATTVNPGESFRYGAGQGVSKGMDRLAAYYINLADKIHPVIEVDAGRQVDIVFLQGVTMERASPQSAAN
jgi:conjugal transfer pilus assembly protein TraB